MKAGRLGAGSTTVNTLKKFYQVPDDAKKTAVNINLCNRAPGAVKIRLAIALTDVPTDDDYVEYDETLKRGKPLERTGFALSPGERVFVWADSAAVSVRVHGFEE
ncbi:hypothetical protein [Pseudomonas syringae]|uniref:Uncharacterized protein n=1 Tax=Pseudomonas syringae TaxID=317 RepID=A0A085V493_PSESX|nr:hypothetical protein [Pseudomonas syringae]KFE50256.1 hypothetical protein IV02_17655 [Pseudomonas syringae]